MWREVKLDGLSMAAHYEQGQLKQALTRGDGRVGEDVTENARTIRSLAVALKKAADRATTFEVRGEVVMQKTSFERSTRNGRKRSSLDSLIRAMRLRVHCGRSTRNSPPRASSISLPTFYSAKDGRCCDSQWQNR